jgi:hypothetical protein
MNRREWFDRLYDIAPRIGDPLLHLLAGVLSRPVGTDALLITADSLDEAATEVHLKNFIARAADLRQLAELVRREAAERLTP